MQSNGSASPTVSERVQRAWLEGGLLAQALRPLGVIYRLALALRRLLWQVGIFQPATLPVPVIVVGNWIVGGAGKTPTTLALLELLRERGIRAGVISRGYGRQGEGIHLVSRDSRAVRVGDEPLLIHLRAEVPVCVGRDRVAAARALLRAHPEVQILISDDGLQHWRLPRSLEVLLFDERGLGNGRLLPAGPLRQAPHALPANSLVLYNATAPSTALPGFTARRTLAGAVALADWWRGQPADPVALDALRGERVLAVAGMAQPQRFFDMLEALGLEIERLPLPDHAHFGALPWTELTPHVCVTEKDAVKLHPERIHGTRVWVVALDFTPDEDFVRALDEKLPTLLSPPRQ